MRERETDKARARERERRARGNRKYGQAPLKHARRGIISCGIAGVNFLAITLMLLGAYRSVGSLGSVIGGLACVSMILSGLGVYAAVRGFRVGEVINLSDMPIDSKKECFKMLMQNFGTDGYLYEDICSAVICKKYNIE